MLLEIDCKEYVIASMRKDPLHSILGGMNMCLLLRKKG